MPICASMCVDSKWSATSLSKVPRCRANPVLARILSSPDLCLLIKLDVCLSLLGFFDLSLLLHMSHSSQRWPL